MPGPNRHSRQKMVPIVAGEILGACPWIGLLGIAPDFQAGLVATTEQNRRRSRATMRILQTRNGRSEPKSGCDRKGIIYGQALHCRYAASSYLWRMLLKSYASILTLLVAVSIDTSRCRLKKNSGRQVPSLPLALQRKPRDPEKA